MVASATSRPDGANAQDHYDVAIIGGGPGGSTTGILLKKYNPALRIGIFEKERFPRDHIGESQLPVISKILTEMGVWEKVERAGFPVKIGATYTWGKTTEPWIFELLPFAIVPQDVERPGKYEGWRVQSAFQVERATYDKILLDHAREMGCEVFEETAVREVLNDGRQVNGLRLSDGRTITARYYVDASGNVAILRRALNVECVIPTVLRNVAFWDYWEDPEWANDPETKATRIHIRSLPFGWMWFIRISPTRTSIGLVCPGEYYKKCGKQPRELYHEAMKMEKSIAEKTKNAKHRGKVEATTDWSFVVEQTAGPNWFLVGECGGFADPILSAGLTLTHAGGRELAYTILELDRGELDRGWLLERYHELQTRRVRQHMRFAEYWYSANGIFFSVRENCARIAEESGFKLDPESAFRWLSLGGLGGDFDGQVGIGGQDVASIKQVMMRMQDGDIPWTIDNKNVFTLNLEGAKPGFIGVLHEGRIQQARCWQRGNFRLSDVGMYSIVMKALAKTDDAEELIKLIEKHVAEAGYPGLAATYIHHALQVLEIMVNDHWVLCKTKKRRPLLNVSTPVEGKYVHSDRGEEAKL